MWEFLTNKQAQPGGSEHTSLAPGAIAGIVIGVVAVVGLSAAGFYLFVRRRRQVSSQIPPPPPLKDEEAFTTVSNPISAEKPLNSPAEVGQTSANYSELEGESHVHELDAGQISIEKP